MLKQEINLYQPFTTTRPDSAFLTWKQFWMGHIVLTGLFIFLYMGSLVKVFFLTKEKDHLQQQTVMLEKSFNTLKSKYPSLFFSQNVAQTIDLMQKNIEGEKQFLNNLSPHIPFSEKLLALSHVSVPNVWLTSFSISNSERNIILKGNMLKSEDLQPLLANIATDPIFSTFNFDVNSVENLNNKEGTLTFQITMVKKSNER